jgi:hypothetical protein
MTRKDRGHYAEKHPEDRKVKPEVTQAIKEKSTDGEISCLSAFEVVQALKVSPAEVGFTVDSLEMPIVRCQLGLFGYKPKKRIVKQAESISSELEEAVKAALVEGRLGCAAAWAIADRLGLAKMDVSSACERLKIKIFACQLGAF